MSNVDLGTPKCLPEKRELSSFFFFQGKFCMEHFEIMKLIRKETNLFYMNLN